MSDIGRQPTTPVDEVTTAPIALNSDDTAPSDGRAPQSARAHRFVTVNHWSMVLLIVLAILSGMRLGWRYIDSHFGARTGWWSSIIGSIAPTGTMFGVNLINMHVTLAFAVLATVVLSCIYLLRSRTLTRLRLTSRDIDKLREGIKQGDLWHDKWVLVGQFAGQRGELNARLPVLKRQSYWPHQPS